MRRAPQTEEEIEAANKELMEIWEKIKAKMNFPQSFDPKVPDVSGIRKLTNALIITARGKPETQLVFAVDDDYIIATVGGPFDCVRRDSFHGYVNDTGLIDGLPFNPIASILFGQVICGDTILFGSFNTENECDGHEHDIEANIIERATSQWILWKHNADERFALFDVMRDAINV